MNANPISGSPLWLTRAAHTGPASIALSGERQPHFRHNRSPLRFSIDAPESKLSLILLGCERGDLNPHALRHWILSPARLPFRHSRAQSRFRGLSNYWKRVVF